MAGRKPENTPRCGQSGSDPPRDNRSHSRGWGGQEVRAITCWVWGPSSLLPTTGRQGRMHRGCRTQGWESRQVPTDGRKLLSLRTQNWHQTRSLHHCSPQHFRGTCQLSQDPTCCPWRSRGRDFPPPAPSQAQGPWAARESQHALPLPLGTQNLPN